MNKLIRLVTVATFVAVGILGSASVSPASATSTRYQHFYQVADGPHDTPQPNATTTSTIREITYTLDAAGNRITSSQVIRYQTYTCQVIEYAAWGKVIGSCSPYLPHYHNNSIDGNPTDL